MNEDDIIESAKAYITDSSDESTIYVGCDSNVYQKKGVWYASYARVIVIHIDSSRGCKVFGDVIVLPEYGNLRQRLMQEVWYAADLGLEMSKVAGNKTMEVHLDLNTEQKHKSSMVLKEAMGMIRGMGMTPKVKPDSWAASACADKYCRI